MTTIDAAPATEQSDLELVSQCIAGNRDAFGRVVARYQALICSLAYSATGSLSQSQDLSQETFVIAWQQLPELREPAKLRSWLCGIVRNRIHKALRRQGTEPDHAGESLEAAQELPSSELLPFEQAISREEEIVLWRSLERIPEIYREPLILFYREQQSIEAVAQNLELSEDAVRQRLSRGRKLLHEQVLAFVEGALGRTRPEKVFTLSVLAALPTFSVSAKAATVGATAAQGSATAKAAMATGLSAFLLGQSLIFFGNYYGYRASLAAAQSDVERGAIKTFFRRNILLTLGFFIPFAAWVLWEVRNQKDHLSWFGLLPGLLVIYILVTFVAFMATHRKRRAYLTGLMARSGGADFPKPAWEYRSRWNFMGLPLVHIRIGDRFAMLRSPVKAWFAAGSYAIGGVFAYGGLAIAPVSIGFCAIGLLPFGAVTMGMIALGGVSLGVWSFGGLAVGWQALGGCALAWNAACGNVALAHAFTIGHDEFSRQFMRASLFFRSAVTFDRYWIWWNLFWVIPMMVQGQILARQRRRRMEDGASKAATQ